MEFEIIERTQIRKNGNSTIITIPKKITTYTGLQPKDWVKILIKKIKPPKKEENYEKRI